MQLHNSLTNQIEPVEDSSVSLYSCGPTVYDNVHIGNLFAFIVADTVRRSLEISGKKIKHVMNTTDVDDKTIKRSLTEHPEMKPKEALKLTTRKFEEIFIDDSKKVGIDISRIQIVRATEHIKQMQAMILDLFKAKIAYVADDGIYFSIESYKDNYKYGVLSKITNESTGMARVANDEYDKDNIHDFALWKRSEPNEPAWDFEIEGENIAGRPGWHIECSAMSTAHLPQPMTIHTGGVDLKFPHHENEIAQSTGSNGKQFAKFFIHSEHVLVDSKKMSKSLGNFYTLRNVEDKGFESLAFRLLVLQSHYRHQLNFSWHSLEAAQNFLHKLRRAADRQFQPTDSSDLNLEIFKDAKKDILNSLQNDLETPQALSSLAKLINIIENNSLDSKSIKELIELLGFVDQAFGLDLSNRQDIDMNQKRLIEQRNNARDNNDYESSDRARDELKANGINLKDTDFGTIWFRE
jgi:cysteinyl-tRNA synthetase